MKKLVLILMFVFGLCIPAFAQWDIEYDQRKNIVYITTINTNQGEAWLTITINGDNTLIIFMQFQDMHLSSENIKIEHKFDENESKFITGKRDREKLVLFASSRNHENTLDFIEKLKASVQLSIKFSDGYKKVRTFIFDVSNLQGMFERLDECAED